MTVFPQTRELTIRSDLAEARRVQAEIEAALALAPFDERELFGIRLAVEEAFVNAIKHGNRLDPAKHVHVRYAVHADGFDIRIADEGPGFDPNDVPDPLAPENLERPCGRGLLLIRHYMTEVNYSDSGRSLTMCKRVGR